MRYLFLILTLLAGCSTSIHFDTRPQAAAPKMTYLEACERVRQAEAKRDNAAGLFKQVADIAWRKPIGSPERDHWEQKRQEAGELVDQLDAAVKQANADRDAISK